MVYDYTSVCGGGRETTPPLAGWKAAPLTSEICRAASDESHMGYHSAEGVNVFLPRSLQFAVASRQATRCHLSSNDNGWQ